jgi:hypothetical protein
VFIKARQFWSKYISQTTVFNQAQEKPKCHGLRTMKQEWSDYEVHALNIVDLSLVVRECCEYSFEPSNSFWLTIRVLCLEKEGMSWECPVEITFYLSFRISVKFKLSQILKSLFHLRVILSDIASWSRRVPWSSPNTHSW